MLLNQNENVNGHRPSVDVLMHSVALEYGSRAVGVIMTGMGKDGAEGLRELHRRGGHVIAQDKDSSVIYGMNREVVQNGDADEVVPVDAIAARIMEALREPDARQGRRYEAERTLQPGQHRQPVAGDRLRGHRAAGDGGHRDVHLRGMRDWTWPLDAEPRHPPLLHLAARAPEPRPGAWSARCASRSSWPSLGLKRLKAHPHHG